MTTTMRPMTVTLATLLVVLVCLAPALADVYQWGCVKVANAPVNPTKAKVIPCPANGPKCGVYTVCNTKGLISIVCDQCAKPTQAAPGYVCDFVKHKCKTNRADKAQGMDGLPCASQAECSPRLMCASDNSKVKSTTGRRCCWKGRCPPGICGADQLFYNNTCGDKPIRCPIRC